MTISYFYLYLFVDLFFNVILLFILAGIYKDYIIDCGYIFILNMSLLLLYIVDKVNNIDNNCLTIKKKST